MYRPHRTWQPITLSSRPPSNEPLGAAQLTKRLVLIDQDRPAACARHYASQLFCDWCLPDDLVADALLIISELVANAEQHAADAGGPEEVWLAMLAGRLGIAVSDREPRPPASVASDDCAESGRGLRIISALAEAYGCFASATRKIVWVELMAPSLVPEVRQKGLIAV